VTTGNKTWDFRQTFSVAGISGSMWRGQYRSRIWSGADNSRTAFKRVVLKPRKIPRKYLGTKKAKYFFVDPFQSPYRTEWVKPPRREVIEDHNYTATGFRVDQQIGMAIKLSTYQGENQQNFPALPADPWTSNHDLELLQKVQSRVVGSSFDPFVFLGTAHQSLGTIAESTVKVANAVRNLRRLRIADAVHDLGLSQRFAGKYKKTLQRHGPDSAWLELQYGWLPLLSDVHDASQCLAHHLNSPRIVRIDVERNLGSEQHPLLYNINDTNNRYQYQGVRISRGKRLIAYFKEGTVPSMGQVLNPLSLGWELLPWSFVADWFIPIETYLAARGVTPALSKSKVVVCSRFVGRFSGRPVGINGWIVHPLYTGRSVTERWSFSRTVTNGAAYLLHNPVMKPFSAVPSWARAENALALVVGVFKRKL